MPGNTDIFPQITFTIIARLRYPWKLPQYVRIVQYVTWGPREWLDFGGNFLKQHQSRARALVINTYSWSPQQRTGLLVQPQAKGAHERLVRRSNTSNPSVCIPMYRV